MGKKDKSQSAKAAAQPAAGIPFLGGNASIDPSLASLFDQSAGPVKAPSIQPSIPEAEKEDEEIEDEEPEQEDEDDDEVMGEAEDSDASSEPETEAPSRKRKRANADDLEESYLRRIEKEEEKEKERRRASEKAKRQKVDAEKDGDESSDESNDESEDDEEESSEDEDKTAPVHESQKADSSEIGKSNRTVFLGNVSTEAIKSKSAKKTLLKHLASFCSSLPESTGPHTVESIRFRSTAFASGGKVPKRASFARKEVLDETTPSTNAYAVYSTIPAARKAPIALNGTVVLDRHLRVDSVAHPSATDHKRCVFVGNLDFVDNAATGDDEKPKKKRAPADVEEGLWRTFNAHTTTPKERKSKGNVESVRVIRDNLTRVGKGFAYVQFYDQNGVEEALLLNEKKFPPMLPRKLRVSRAKKVLKKREAPEPARGKGIGESQRTLQGRAGKLFGRAGAAKVRNAEKRSISQNSTVFEGHRATEGSAIKVKTKSRGSKGKPKNRSSQRAAAYRAAGGRQGKMAKKSS